MSEQLCWSLLQPQPAAGHGVQSEVPCGGQEHSPSREQRHPRGIWEPSCTNLPIAELSCLSSHTAELLDAAPGCN